ncbi:hypothetical protein H0H87_001746, partial [Tephrocybe sp. NHM501043]
MCSFHPLSSIASYLSSTPEFAALISLSILQASSNSKATLHTLFEALMTSPQGTYQPLLTMLVACYTMSNMHPGEERNVVDLFLWCNKQFPGNIGMFCVFVLNFVRFKLGEAIFLAMGDLHVYVSG